MAFRQTPRMMTMTTVLCYVSNLVRANLQLHVLADLKNTLCLGV